MPWIAKYTFLLQILGRKLCTESRQAVSSNVNKLIGVAFPVQSLCPFLFFFSFKHSPPKGKHNPTLILSVQCCSKHVNCGSSAGKGFSKTLVWCSTARCHCSAQPPGTPGSCRYGFWDAAEKLNPFPLIPFPVFLCSLFLAIWTITLHGNSRFNVLLSITF